MQSRREILKLWTTAAAVLAAPPAAMALAQAAPVDKPLWFYRRFPTVSMDLVMIGDQLLGRVVRHRLYGHAPGTVLIDNARWERLGAGPVDCFLRVTPDFTIGFATPNGRVYRFYDETDFPEGFEPVPAP